MGNLRQSMTDEEWEALEEAIRSKKQKSLDVLDDREKVVYIAGKVTGEPVEQCRAKFANAQKEWEAKGYTVLNPIELVGNPNAQWDDAMRICIASLMTAKTAYFLNDWNNSKGAVLEHQIAQALQIKIIYQK